MMTELLIIEAPKHDVLTSPEGDVHEQDVKIGFQASNNEAEYEVLIVGLKNSHYMKMEELGIYSDSQ